MFSNGSDPVLQEVGPYVYREEREKVNIAFNPNGSMVSYNQVKRWFFVPELTSSSLDDEVYHLNIPMIAAADYIRKLPPIFTIIAIPAMNNMISKTGSTLYPKHTIRQLLFEGYTDGLIKEAAKMESSNLPDSFAWFLGLNNTVRDDRYSIYTGKYDLSKLGRIYSWKNSTNLPMHSGPCSSFDSINHELLPPSTSTASSVKFFIGEICRSLKFRYKSKVKVKGITLNRYIVDETNFDYSIQENKCFCPEDGCPKKGIGDTSSCLFNTPGAISQPHFLNADKSYLKLLRGLNPDPHKHSSYMDIHPVSYCPLN